MAYWGVIVVVVILIIIQIRGSYCEGEPLLLFGIFVSILEKKREGTYLGSW